MNKKVVSFYWVKDLHLINIYGVIIMYKEFLVSPGPTAVPPDTLLLMARPLYHHRTQRFDNVFAETSEKLKGLFKTKEDVYILASSGTGAMECAVVNLISEGDKVIVINGGKFGERWTKISKKYGATVIEIEVTWGESVNPAAFEECLKQNSDAKAVLIQYSETSTGALHDIKKIASITKKTNALLIVDAITALAVHPLEMDEWGIDCVVSGSQKALMLPPGLGFIALSKRAYDVSQVNKTPRFYFDIESAKKNLAKKTTAFTPATTLIIGLNDILDKINAEGLDNVYARHENIALATRSGVEALGMTLFAKNPSNGVTSALAPKGIEGKKIKSVMEKKYKVSIAGSQDVEKADIIRIGHIGYYDKSDIVTTLSALEFALKDLGHNFNFGVSLAAAQEVLYKGKE